MQRKPSASFTNHCHGSESLFLCLSFVLRAKTSRQIYFFWQTEHSILLHTSILFMFPRFSQSAGNATHHGRQFSLPRGGTIWSVPCVLLICVHAEPQPNDGTTCKTRSSAQGNCSAKSRVAVFYLNWKLRYNLLLRWLLYNKNLQQVAKVMLT